MRRLLITGYAAVIRFVLTLMMIALLLAVALQVGARYVAFVPRLIWTEEAARFCFIWVIMLGAIVAVHERTHFVVDLFGKMNAGLEFMLRLIVTALSLALAAVFIVYGTVFAEFGARQVAPMTGVSMLALYIAWPFVGASWIVFLIDGLFDDIKALQRGEAR